jgi:hypothetical protein
MCEEIGCDATKKHPNAETFGFDCVIRGNEAPSLPSLSANVSEMCLEAKFWWELAEAM